MLRVKTPFEADALLKERFTRKAACEKLPLCEALGRTLSDDVISRENVPDFRRSLVDGYAVRAEDTFGCSETIPALLHLEGEVKMGQPAEITLAKGSCAYVPTGGQLPDGADAMVMMEFCEDFCDETIAVEKPVAPGSHVIFRGDDVSAGDVLFLQGHRILSKDIGAFAALGFGHISVFRRPRVAILSTGNEIVPSETETLNLGQIRDVNGPMLSAAVTASGGEPVYLGIFPDNSQVLENAVAVAVKASDIVLISGGSSVGIKDTTEAVLSNLGELLFHGLALKPGKPTLAADICGKPVFGLPGHPLAAYFIYCLLVRPLLYEMLDSTPQNRTVSARSAAAIPSNHGREECVPIRLEGERAIPIMGKSGLITTLSGADGYIRIPRNAEGIEQGESVQVFLFSEEL